MDVLDFLNSKDISQYLREIDYHLSPIQAAYVIFASDKYGVVQKQAAWRELINDYPDETLKTRRGDLPNMLLGDFLKQFIAIQNELIAECETGEGIYSYEYFSKDDGYWIEERGFYKDFASCFQAIKDDLDENEYEKIRIKKNYFGEGRKSIELELLPGGEVFDVTESAFLSGEKSDIFDAFTWFWIDIPMPFKRGDIVKIISEPFHEKQNEWDDVVVLTDMSNWDSKTLKENGYKNGKNKRDHVDFAWRNKHIWRLKEDGDETDMDVYGYGIYDDGTVFHEVWFPYLNV